jgi:hypothetical protein
MKKSAPQIRKLFFCAAITAIATSASATVSLFEPFNYDPAVATTLKGQKPDTRQWNNAGPAATPIDDATTGMPHVEAGNLTMPAGVPAATGNMAVFGGAGEGTRINVDTSGQTIAVDGTTLYYSLGLKVTSTGHLTATGQILTCFTQYLDGGSGSQTSLGALLWVKPGSDVNHYKLGFGPNGSSAHILWDEGHDYPVGATQFIVASDTQPTTGINADDISRVWYNPTSLGGSAPAPNVTTTLHDFADTANAVVGDMNFFGSFEIRRPPSPSNDYPDINTVFIDELRLGTSYAEVTPTLSAPEPSILGIFVLGVGMFGRRRRGR